LKTGEIERITSLPGPRLHHIMIHKKGAEVARIIGGIDNDFNALDICYTFDLKNQNYKTLVTLKYARERCGALETETYVMVFGGYHHL